jgi:hypothetical protein
MRWEEHVVLIGETRRAYRLLVGTGWFDNVKVAFQEIQQGCGLH